MQSEEKKDFREKLESELGNVDWKALNAHYLRGALIIVSQDLDIVDVGINIAEDNATEIQRWMEAGKLLKPTEENVKAWKASGTHFLSLILTPFVLIQEVPSKKDETTIH